MLTSILSAEQRATYLANGYLVAPQVVPDSFLDDLQTHLEAVVEARVAEWPRAPLLGPGSSRSQLRSRYHCAWIAAGRPIPPTGSYEGLFCGAWCSELADQTWIKEVVAGLFGVEEVRPLDSSFARAKFPYDERSSLPWHQDAQCLERISGVDFVTAWIPLFDVLQENPCLEVSPVDAGQGMFEPTWSPQMGYTFMSEADVERLERVHRISLRRGDVLLLSPFIPHRSVNNASPHIRWSVDFRYAPMGERLMDRAPSAR